LALWKRFDENALLRLESPPSQILRCAIQTSLRHFDIAYPEDDATSAIVCDSLSFAPFYRRKKSFDQIFSKVVPLIAPKTKHTAVREMKPRPRRAFVNLFHREKR
jgi:hypothetical protein